MYLSGRYEGGGRREGRGQNDTVDEVFFHKYKIKAYIYKMNLERVPIIYIGINNLFRKTTYNWNYDRNMMTGTKIVDEIAGTGTFNVTATSGVVTIWFHSDGSVTSSGFEITWNVQGISTTCSGSASGLTVDAVSATGATLSWTGDAGSYNVYVDNRMVATTSGTSHTLTDLNPGMAHEVTVTPTGIGATICCSDTALIRSDFCNGTELPLQEKFDDITLGAIPACWIRSMNFDDEESKPQVVEAGRQGRAMLLSCGNNATPSHFGMVVGPHIGDAENTWHVGFRLKASHDWTRLVVGFCDNTSSEYNSYGFVPMDTLELMQPGTWTEHHYTWTRPAGKSRLAFRMIRDMQDGDMRTVYIDNVRIEKCGIYNLRNYRTDAFGTYVEWTTSGTPSTPPDAIAPWSTRSTSTATTPTPSMSTAATTRCPTPGTATPSRPTPRSPTP